MAEQCPLAGRNAFELGADSQGIVWDTGLPERCRLHVAQALGRAGAKTTFYRPELRADQIEGLESGTIDLSASVGVFLPEPGRSRAQAVRDVVIDPLGSNEGVVLSRTIAPLPCSFGV
jgi:hypothetical protein